MPPKEEWLWRQAIHCVKAVTSRCTVGHACGVSLLFAPPSGFILYRKNVLQTLFFILNRPLTFFWVSSYFHLLPQTVAGAILSGYGVLILGAVIKSKIGGKAPEPEPVAPVAASAASSGDLPSIESPEFETFIESADDAAIMKWVDSASN